ncbi:DUF58 domain-containing protein [Ramlibacter sp. H39-3-26]|uniref:DUF58 domain-containing protein n=1 Tax=Curvibacter soli TaxID=3031331 RepID=UPI0023DA04D5|nr:DUF58 domain-containing protein [Ramlibacter sp. H39-3-26]MDF1485083.1 DUF58 domain-containing protein [Ramlibacter sp. H39-3-26]
MASLALGDLNPLTLARRRLQQWWQSRLPFTDTLALTQRNVYILPTGAGWMLALTLAVLLVASINYQLNLGYLLTFLLAGSAAVGMHMCHATLRGLELHLAPPQPQFLGTPVGLDIRLASTRGGTRYGIGVAVHGAGHWAWTDVPAQGSASLRIAFQPARRGLQHVPTLTVQTLYPLGTFRVWSLWRPAAQVLVYPAPEVGAPPLPPGEPRAGGGGAAPSRGAGEFDGVRPYRRGDPLKLVVWKQVARAAARGSDDLVSRDAQQAQQQALWLDAQRTGLPTLDGRLSRLCAWVLQADRMGLEYGLRVPGAEIAPGGGEAHRRRCLEALALC